MTLSCEKLYSIFQNFVLIFNHEIVSNFPIFCLYVEKISVLFFQNFTHNKLFLIFPYFVLNEEKILVLHFHYFFGRKINSTFMILATQEFYYTIIFGVSIHALRRFVFATLGLLR